MDTPVPVGEVIFRPDSEQGNEGPGSVARIREGRYQTEAGKGVVGGPYVVEIVGFDGIASTESTDGGVLFGPVILQLTLPDSASTQDFRLP